MRTKFAAKVLVIFLILLVLVIAGSEAFGHERRDVAKYQFVVGFIVEPPIEGQKNGVELRVTNNATGQALPVEGVEKTLKVEVTHVPSGVSKTFDLRTIFRDPGHYTTDLILTAPGYYRFRFFGTIEGTQVNETFNSRSGGGGFNDVESSAGLQFPQQLPEVRELASAVKGAEASATKAQDTAGSSRNLAVAGIVLGALGIASGIGFSMAARRKR